MTPRLEIWAIEGLPEVHAGDDIADLLVQAKPGLQDGDVIVITSKIVSKAEGRLVVGSRTDHLDAETARLVASRGDTQIVETHHGFVLAAAGIDASNVPAGTVALLPRDPDVSARRIRSTLRAAIDVDVGVIVSDTMGRPWRDGLVDSAIGAAGLDVLWDLRGQHDPTGHRLDATVIAIGDELAAAADLVKGKLAAAPAAVIRGFPFSCNDPDRGARPLIRPAADDLFRLGSREARRQLVRDSAPVSGDDTSTTRVDDVPVRRAVAALGAVGVELSIIDGGGVVSATGDPLQVGVVLGRLLTALAAEELRGALTAPPAGATAAIRVLRER